MCEISQQDEGEEQEENQESFLSKMGKFPQDST